MSELGKKPGPNEYIPTGGFGLTPKQRAAKERHTIITASPTGEKAQPQEPLTRLPGAVKLDKAAHIATRHGAKHETTTGTQKLSESDIAGRWDDMAKEHPEAVDTAAKRGDTDAISAINRYKGRHISDK